MKRTKTNAQAVKESDTKLEILNIRFPFEMELTDNLLKMKAKKRNSKGRRVSRTEIIFDFSKGIL